MQRGIETEIKFVGARLADTKEVLFYETGVQVLELKEVKDSYVLARVKLDADCPLGEHKVRVRTKTGISDFRTFIVGPFPQVEEKEPNNTLEKAQKIPLNSTVLGTVSNEDVDYYAVELKKGEPLVILSSPELREEVKQKEAVVKQADSAIVQARAGVRVAEANVTKAESQRAELKAGVACTPSWMASSSTARPSPQCAARVARGERKTGRRNRPQAVEMAAAWLMVPQIGRAHV